jgi:hypothetical protein
MSDPRLEYVNLPTWQQHKQQRLLGSDYVVIEPNNSLDEVPTQVEFEINNSAPLLFGPMSKFQIRGHFDTRATDNDDWTVCSAAEASNVLLAPNWFEMLIKSVDVFHNNQRISASDEARFIPAHLNAMLYAYMEPTAKKLLCPQPVHPGYCVPVDKDSWKLDAEPYSSYAKRVFINLAFTFNYVPIFQFPFYQGSNFLTDGSTPRMVPMQNLGKLSVRFTFFDKQDHIFRNKANNTKKYRFAFTDFNLILEEARLAPTFERTLLAAKKPLAYPGVTRLQLVESIPGGTAAFKTRFQDICMPEALFIFCLDKQVASGTYSFATSTKENVFLPHNINAVDLSFDGKRFSLKEPHFGNFREDIIEPKGLFDHLAVPPFGVNLDPAMASFTKLEEGGDHSAYPHIYIPLVHYSGDKSRLIPAMDDGSCVAKRGDLDISFKFILNNSTADAVYVIYAIYTDVAIILDLKNKYFMSPYLSNMN